MGIMAKDTKQDTIQNQASGGQQVSFAKRDGILSGGTFHLLSPDLPAMPREMSHKKDSVNFYFVKDLQ